MPIDPDALASSLTSLADLSAAKGGLDRTLELVIDETKRLFAVDGSGLMLITESGILRYAVASDERGRQLEKIQEQVDEGPCVDAFEKFAPVVGADVARDPRWPSFGPVAARNGIRSVLGVPVSLEDTQIGTLNVYSMRPHDWDDSEVEAIQAFGRVVASVLRAAVDAHVRGRIAEQLQYALDHRVVIEQAKGVLMEREGLDAVAAFEMLRRAARSNRERVADLATRVISGQALQRPASPI